MFAGALSFRAKTFVLAGLLIALSALGAGASAEAPAQQVVPQTFGATADLSGEEIPELRTITSRTHLGEDGLFVAAHYLTPIHYKDAEGLLQPIDPTLVPAPGGYQNRANDVRVFVPANLVAPVRVEKDGAWASFQLIGAEAEAEVEGSSATYRDAFAGVDARYTATSTGVKEALVLRDASAPSEFRFLLLTAPSLVPRLRDGAVELADAAGKTKLSFRAPFMVDSSGNRNYSSRAVSFSLADDAAPGYLLTLSADRSWLDDPARVYPVTIDPTLDAEDSIFGQTYMDCFIKSSGGNDCYRDWFSVGYPSPGDLARSLLRWNLSDVPANANVIEAEMVLRLLGSGGFEVSLHELTNPYTKSARWTTYDGTNPWPGGPGGTYAAQPITSTTVNSSDTYVSFYPTTLVAAWVAGTKPNHGMLLKAVDESVDQKVDFSSADHVICSPCYAGPVLYVSYQEEEPPQQDDPDYFFAGDPGEPPDPEPTDCDNPDAGNEMEPDPTLCGGGAGPSSADASVSSTAPPVSWSPKPWTPTTKVVKFRNADGVWWIYNRCIDYRSGTPPDEFRHNVGPGYIARFFRGSTRYVDDFRARRDVGEPGYLNRVHAGLGTFGWHHTRGPVNNSPAGDDPTTPEVETQVDRLPPGYAIEGRMCAPTNNNNGVCNVTFPADGPKFVEGSKPHVTYDIDVWLRDSAGGSGCLANSLARVRYRYSFYRSSIKVWIAVTLYPRGDPPEGKRFAKEPKFATVVRGGNYTRISSYGGSSATTWRKSVMKGATEPVPPQTKELSTDHTAANDRVRVQWDHGTRSDQPGFTCSPSQCFNVVMRSYPTSSGGNVSRHQPPSRWENSTTIAKPLGLDAWAITSEAEGRSITWPRDTRGGNGMSFCNVTPHPDDDGPDNEFQDDEIARVSGRATTGIDGSRRWEHGGWKTADHPADPANNPNPYTSGFTFFTAWTGGRGPGDCEPLENMFGAQQESWGTYASYSLGPGWELR
jgi:hypothetical protein